MQNNMAYCEHLFDNTTDGYVQLIKIKENKELKIYNTNIKGLKEIVEVVKGETDAYLAPNTMYKPFRKVENIRQFRALYIDLDGHEGNQLGVTYEIFELAEKDIIPKPSMVVDSGRGVHLYWSITNAPFQALHTWQSIEDYLYFQLKKYGADIQATDGARLLRIPGTINGKNNQNCRVIYIDEELQYSMYDLREKYLKCKVKPYQLELHQTKELKKKTNGVISNLYNSYTLHLARSEDIKMLCKLRNYDVEGYRNFILHCFAYWIGIYIRDIEQLEKEVIELNNAFKKPLKETEVNAILRCIPKAIDKFLNYQQYLKNGQVKKVTKGMRDKGGYWYKNETLIDRLNITLEEQKKFKTIISQGEKYSRNNKRRMDARRNEEGLTLKQQELKELKEKVMKLKEKAINNTQIAEKLNIDRAKVRRLLKI